MASNSLVGTWRLVSWENHHESGAVRYPLGPDAEGFISYTPDGYVFVHIMAKDRPMHSKGGLLGGGTAEVERSANTHVSYCGTYEIDGNEVIHHVAVSSFPNWIASEQRRDWKREGGNLSLSARDVRVGDEKVDAHLIWRLLAPSQDGGRPPGR